MAKFEKREAAHMLRKKGKSIGEIAQELGVSKSSVSVWCRDVALTIAQKERLNKNSFTAGNKGRMLGAEMNRQKRINSLRSFEVSGREEIGKLSNRDLTMLATALFWAEGAKTGSRFIFINSDPDMILIMVRYLIEVLKVEPLRISATVQINRVHEYRIDSVRQFWSSILKLPKERFGETYYVEAIPKKKYENHDSYNGILRLRVNNGASLQYKLLGYISALRQ